MTVNTEMIAKIPIVIPSSERNVRSLLTRNELNANEKLSKINLANNIISVHMEIKIQFVLKIFINLSILYGFYNKY